MSFIKIFDKDRCSQNVLYESVLAKYQRKHSDIVTDTCHLMNEIENCSEFLKSISREFKSMNCYTERAMAKSLNNVTDYCIVHGCDYSNSFTCQVTTTNNCKVSFVVELYFPACIRISAVKTDDAYFTNKKVIFDVIDKSLNLINEILTEELYRIKNIIMQLNLVYKDYPSVINGNLDNIRKAFLHNIKQLINYRGFYCVPHEVNLKYNSFYLIDDSSQLKEFIEQSSDGDTRRFTPSEVKFVSAESFDNYALAKKLLADKYNTTFCWHGILGKINILWVKFVTCK